jgi:hypothetical protein
VLLFGDLAKASVEPEKSKISELVVKLGHITTELENSRNSVETKKQMLALASKLQAKDVSTLFVFLEFPTSEKL